MCVQLAAVLRQRQQQLAQPITAAATSGGARCSSGMTSSAAYGPASAVGAARSDTLDATDGIRHGAENEEDIPASAANSHSSTDASCMSACATARPYYTKRNSKIPKNSLTISCGLVDRWQQQGELG